MTGSHVQIATVALHYRIALGVAAVATVLFMIASRQTTAPVLAASVSETFRLQCLSSEQALEFLKPIFPPSVSISARVDSPLGIIRVVASPKEMTRVRWVLDRYDTPTVSQCGVQLTVPKALKVP